MYNSSFMIGKKLANRYEILRELGRGGMGVVFLARDPLLDRDVAIKLLSPGLVNAESSERFQREARMVAKLDHPGIVSVHDIGEQDGTLFFVMPYVQGASLRSFLDSGSFNFGEVLEVAAQVAEALDYSHGKGVVHRDVKPENILVVREESGELRVRVTDFGLAIASKDHRLTKSGAFVGTVSYLSPEQVSGKGIDARSDIYSLGIVLYECLAGQPPFIGEVLSVLVKIASEQPRPLRELGAQVEEEIESFVLQCIEKDPNLRPQRAKEVADAIRSFREHLGDTDRERMMYVAFKAETIQSDRPVLPAFVGREKEFAELQQKLSAAMAGECQFVVVSGEAGIGKSRLLDEMEKVARSKQMRVLHARFVEQENAFPYHAFCEAIQEYFHLKTSTHSSTPADFNDLAADLIALFPVLAEEISGSQRLTPAGESARMQDRTYIFDLLARSFLRIASGKPLVIIFEDLHQGDVSLEALQYIIRRLGSTPTLIAATYRQAEVDKHHPLFRLLNSFQGDRRFSAIHLGPLGSNEHRSLLRTLTGTSNLEDDFVQRLFEATEGNPHFLRELVRSLMDSGRILKSETGSLNLSGEGIAFSEALPANIQQTIEKRMERLPEDLREILLLASVLGKGFDFEELKLLTEQKDLDDSVDRLISAGFLEEQRGRGDRLFFSSGIVRDVIYTAIPRRKRRSLHRKYAEALEHRHQTHLERIYPQLVHHYAEGDVAEKVILYGMELARKSLASFSPEDALRAARSVLDFCQEDGSTIHAQVRALMAEGHRMIGSADTALQEFDAAIRGFEKCGDTAMAVRAMALAAETAWESRKVEQADHFLNKGVPAARSSGETESLVRLLSLGAKVENLRGEHEKATRYLSELQQLKPAVAKSEMTLPIGGKLVVGLSAPMGASHPVQIRILEEAEVLGNVFETLVGTDDQGHLLPKLCEDWQELKDGKIFLFLIRPGIALHDGTSLNSTIVKQCLENSIRLSAERLPAAFSAIQGVREFLNDNTSDVSGITIPSENRLQIQLETAFHIYPALLTDFRCAIAGSDDKMGTGPFCIESFRADRVTLVRNERYWKEKPLLDSIEFRCAVHSSDLATAFRSGDLDLAGSLLPQDFDQLVVDRRLRASVVEATKKNLYFVLLNQNSPLSHEPDFRKALTRVIRTDDLVRGTLGRLGQTAEGLFPPGILGHDPSRRRQPLSRDEAAALLERFEKPIRVRAAVHPVYQDRYSAFLKKLLSAWSEIGIEVSIETPSMQPFLDASRKPEGIDLFIGRWTADYEDPDGFAFGVFHSKSGFVRKFYSSEELDQIVNRARLETLPALREGLYRKIDVLLQDSGFFLPLFHEIDYRLGSPLVKRMTLESSPPFVNYAQVGKLTSGPAIASSSGGVLQVPSTGEISNLDPSFTITAWQQEVNPAIFETLTAQSEGARIAPWLAAEFSVENGGRSFRFRLRDQIRFHDGRRLSARDVRYSFEHLLRSGDPGSNWLLAPIVGAKEILAGEHSDLSGFEILSTLEFRITLDQPLPFFPSLLAFTPAAIIPEGTEKFSGSWQDGCVGTGPFRVVRFDPGSKIELEANPYYWRPGYPKLDGLVFHCNVSPANIASGFLSGRFSLAWDLLRADVDTLRHDPQFGLRYFETPSLSTYVIMFNIHRGPLASEELRRHFKKMVDVAGLVKRTAGRLAIPAGGLIPPGLLGYEPFRMETRKAASSTRGSRFTTVGQNVELNCMIHSIYEGPYAPVAQELFTILRKLRLQPIVVERKSEYANTPQLADTVDINFTRWIADYPDADAFTYGMIHSEKGLHGRYVGTPEVDRLIERGRSETDPDVRHRIYREIEEVIERRALMLPLFHEQTYRFARPEVQDFEFRHSYPTVAYENLWLRK